MIRLFKFVLVVLMLALVALLSAVTTMHFAIHGAEVKIPDFKGLTAADAFHRAAALGVNLSIDDRFYSAEMPVGHILTQSPAPGTVVRREWHVRLTESLGPQRVAIPNVVGQQERLATLEIRRLGLELGSTATMPSAAAPGMVIAQNPPADAEGVERPSVSLLVSAPQPPQPGGYLMPDLVGQPYNVAALSVVRAGLKLAPLQEATVAVPAVPGVNSLAPPVLPTPPGIVLSQSPPAGYRVDAATPVALTVAR